jgi:hypothetical protein
MVGWLRTALFAPRTPGKHSHAGLAQHHVQPPGNIPAAPRRTHIAINGDALPMMRPYVLVVAEARRNGAVSW